MLNKKIILLISLLLVTGSSYFIFHRKKNNNDEINIIDNSDNSINDNVNEDNQEELINENVESSSSFLLVIIIIIVVIIIAAAIVFFIFYRRNKKKKEEDPGKKEEEDPGKKEIIIKENAEEEKFFEEYKQFKEKEANKTKIAQETKEDIIKQLVTLFLNDIKNEYQKTFQNVQGEYNPNKCIIDFFNNVKNNKKQKPLIRDGLTLYRFNRVEHAELLRKIIFNFFSVTKSDEYKDINFNNKDDENQKNIMYLFIATIIEPFFNAIQEKAIFFYRADNNLIPFKVILLDMVYMVSQQKEIEEKGEFFKYVLNSNIFLLIFHKLVKEIFPFDFSQYIPH